MSLHNLRIRWLGATLASVLVSLSVSVGFTESPLLTEGELPAQQRLSLKEKLRFRAGVSQYTWTYPKKVAERGNDVLRFNNVREFEGLPTELTNITTKPWYEISPYDQSPYNQKERVDFNRRSLLKIYSADIDHMTFYHQTSFPAVDKLIDLSDTATDTARAGGPLQWSALRFTNKQLNAGFYTHIDPGNSLELLLPTTNSEAILKIDVKNKTNVVVMELYQPIDDKECETALRLLTGDADFWKNYREQHQTGTAYDFDLFHNAIVSVLRERYGIPVDVILYVKDFMTASYGKSTRNVFTWAVILDRQLLVGADVPKVFDGRLSLHQPTLGDGVDERQFVELSRKALASFIRYPNLREMISDALRPTIISANERLAKMIGREKKSQHYFWNTVFPNFKKQIFSENSALFASLISHIENSGAAADEKTVFNFLHENLISGPQLYRPPVRCSNVFAQGTKTE